MREGIYSELPPMSEDEAGRGCFDFVRRSKGLRLSPIGGTPLAARVLF